MFFLKYFGLIILSMSLNEWKNNPKDDIKKQNLKNINNIESNSTFLDLQSFFEKFLMTGSSLKILVKNYEAICLIGFCVLIIYIISIIYGIFYMKKKIL